MTAGLFAYLCDNYETVFLRAGAVPALSGLSLQRLEDEDDIEILEVTDLRRKK